MVKITIEVDNELDRVIDIYRAENSLNNKPDAIIKLLNKILEDKKRR